MALALAAASCAAGSPAETRAVAFLAREVPAWHAANRCHSCHNNGDAARALYTAHGLGYELPPEALADTTRWLRRPAGWDDNRGDPRFSDKKLARIQFAAALAEAFDAGLIDYRQPLIEAAESLVSDQHSDGSWQVDAEASVGSPVTYGVFLATYLARNTIERAGTARFAAALARADRWFLEARASTVPDAAAAVLALEDRDSAPARERRSATIALLVAAQASDGGWGPYPRSPAEVFDTALALLALRTVGDASAAEAIARGRAFLIRAQLDSGGWPETTRPSGARSYAQHISTSGWATLALLSSQRRGHR